MITLTSKSGDQKLSILDYDGNRTTNVKYKAFIHDDQLAVLHLQTVDAKHTPAVSQLSVCPGILESEVLNLLSQHSVSNALVCAMFLIEKLEADIVYRSRNCHLLFDRSPYQGICFACLGLFNDLKTNAHTYIVPEYQPKIDVDEDDPPGFLGDEEFESKAEPSTEVKPVVIRIIKEEAVKENQSDEDDYRDQDDDYAVTKPVKNTKIQTWPTQKKKNFTCPECPRRFVSQKFLWNHTHKHHGLQVSPLPAPPGSEYEMMKCPFCDKMLRKYPKEGRKRSKKLSVAVRSHLLCFHPDERNNPQFLEIMEQYEKKEFICTECGKCLYSNQSLEQHMVQSHATHLNTIPCHLCGKFLKTNYLLQAHIKNIHERNISKNALCGDCGKTFTTKSILRRHIDRMHSDQIFKCNECGKEFRSKDALMKHVRIYHNGREPVKCPQCDKSFQEDRNLQKHIRQVQCGPLSLVEIQRGSALIGRELHSVAPPVSLMP